MKTLMILVLLISNICYSQTYSEDQMRRRTLDAIAKFYGIDTLGEEAFRRLQKRYLPKEYEVYIPYFGTMYSIVVDKRISYKMEF